MLYSAARVTHTTLRPLEKYRHRATGSGSGSGCTNFSCSFRSCFQYQFQFHFTHTPKCGSMFKCVENGKQCVTSSASALPPSPKTGLFALLRALFFCQLLLYYFVYTACGQPYSVTLDSVFSVDYGNLVPCSTF